MVTSLAMTRFSTGTVMRPAAGGEGGDRDDRDEPDHPVTAQQRGPADGAHWDFAFWMAAAYSSRMALLSLTKTSSRSNWIFW